MDITSVALNMMSATEWQSLTGCLIIIPTSSASSSNNSSDINSEITTTRYRCRRKTALMQPTQRGLVTWTTVLGTTVRLRRFYRRPPVFPSAFDHILGYSVRQRASLNEISTDSAVATGATWSFTIQYDTTGCQNSYREMENWRTASSNGINSKLQKHYEKQVTRNHNITRFKSKRIYYHTPQISAGKWNLKLVLDLN